MKNEKKGKKAHQIVFFQKWFSERGHSRNGNKKRTRGELGTAATVDVRVFFFHFFCAKWSKWKKGKNGKKCAPSCFFQKRFSKRGHSRNGKWKSKHVASLLQPPPLMCACSFSISSVGSARKWKMIKTGEMRTKRILFKNGFQNEATLVMKNKKANTWQACYSRRHWCARVLFSFLLWEVLENEKSCFFKNGARAALPPSPQA